MNHPLEDSPSEEPAVTDTEMQALLRTPPVFAFVFKPGPNFGPATAAAQWEHARNMFTLLRERKLRSVTALLDGTDVLGVGTLEAGSEEDVAALLRKDPAVAAGRLVFEIRRAASFAVGDV